MTNLSEIVRIGAYRAHRLTTVAHDVLIGGARHPSEAIDLLPRRFRFADRDVVLIAMALRMQVRHPSSR